jgi:transposase
LLLTKCRREGRCDSVTAQAKVRRGGKVLDVPPNLRISAEGLQRAYSTIKAAFTLPCSNGPMEGQINRLKFVKRSINGEAISSSYANEF